MPRKLNHLEPLMSSADNSGRDDWCTPASFLEAVSLVGPIALDPCSNPRSIVKAGAAWTLPQDGLAGDWLKHSRGGLTFVNPPYGRDASGDWIGKCTFEAERGCEIIGLVPSRTDTAWFHHEILRTASAVCFWGGRIQFIGDKSEGTSGATFPSLIPYWGRRTAKFERAFSRYGAVWRLR